MPQAQLVGKIVSYTPVFKDKAINQPRSLGRVVDIEDFAGDQRVYCRHGDINSNFLVRPGDERYSFRMPNCFDR